MTGTPGSRICTTSGLRLVPAAGETAFRVAKDRYGALSVRSNTVVGPFPIGTNPDSGDARGRFDSLGSTIYLADSRQCAYSEVLVGFRQQRAAIARAAESIAWPVDEYIARSTTVHSTDDDKFVVESESSENLILLR